MTHTSQRRGLDPSRPGEEVIVMAMVPKAFRGKKGVREVISDLAVKMLKHGRDHWPKLTNDRLTKIAEGPAADRLGVAFTDLDIVVNLLNDLKKDWIPRNRELGYPISIVLTGLTGDTHACCQKTGFTQHTYLYSLGPFGRVQDLPTGDELALITMCGHGLIAKNRVRDRVQSLQKGDLTLDEAAEDVVRPCKCGIGNQKRAKELLARLAGKS
ncbi:hypothetical protein ACFLRM_03015 [Acidobacteriota bacterium]